MKKVFVVSLDYACKMYVFYLGCACTITNVAVFLHRCWSGLPNHSHDLDRAQAEDTNSH